MTVITVLFVVGLLIAAGIGNTKQKEKLRVTFATLGNKLAGGHDAGTRTAWGEIGGAKVTFRFVVRGSGKHAQSWTEIEAEIPRRYPFRLFIRKHGWRDHGQIERGEMVDIQVGDRAFDDGFLVEAAPAAVARMLLDPRARSYLLSLSQTHWFELLTSHTGERAVLRLDLRSWVWDIPTAMRGIEAMAAIAGRLRGAYATVAAAAEVQTVGTPYRPMLDDRAAQTAADARLAEVARIDQIRTKRTANQQSLAVVLVLAFVFAAILAMAVGH